MAKEIAHVTSQILPFLLPLTYFYLLPRPAAFLQLSSSTSYVPIPTDDLETGVDDDESAPDGTEINVEPKVAANLSIADKWGLAKPMLLKYMLPLCEHTSLILLHFIFMSNNL